MAITNAAPGVVRGRSKTLHVCCSFNSVTAKDILSVDPQYTGTHLIMTSIPNVTNLPVLHVRYIIPVQFKQPYSQEDMDGVVYAGRQLKY